MKDNTRDPKNPLNALRPGSGGLTVQLGMLRQDKTVEAVVRKLVKPQNARLLSNDPERPKSAPSEMLLHTISQMASNNIVDADSLMQVLPDLQLGMRIMVSSILSPKDMVGANLNITSDFKAANVPVFGEMTSYISDFYKQTYKIEERLPKWLENMLFKKGSQPVMVLPESTIDELINGPVKVSTESFAMHFDDNGNVKPLGILGPSDKELTEQQKALRGKAGAYTSIGLESHMIDITQHQGGGISVKVNDEPIVEVTDNPAAMKKSKIRSRIVNDRIRSLLKKDTPHSSPSSIDVERALYNDRQYTASGMTTLRTVDVIDKETVGHPTVVELPAEAVIPVHVPGAPENHIGYFVLLDINGYPLSRTEYINYYNDMVTAESINKDSQLATVISAAAQGMQYGRGVGGGINEREQLTRVYGELIEQDLMERLKNGAYGEGVEIAHLDEIHRIMMARALQRKRTTVLYVPKSMMVYFAYLYNHWGVGQSLLENTKIIGGIRASLLFAQTMAELNNSINKTQMDITLDPDDPEPDETVAKIKGRYLKLRSGALPVGITSPTQLVDYLTAAGISVSVSGNDRYPATKVDISNRENSRVQPNEKLMEDTAKIQFMGMGMHPDLVNTAHEAEFAETIKRNGIIFNKTIRLIQNVFCPQVTFFVKAHTLNSSIMMTDLRNMIKEKLSEIPFAEFPQEEVAQLKTDEDKIDYILTIYMSSLNCSLPAPDEGQNDLLSKAFQEYSDAVDKTFEVLYPDDAFNTNSLGESAEGFKTLLGLAKVYLKRDWMKRNNYMKELLDVLPDENEKLAFNTIIDQFGITADNIRNAVVAFTKKTNPKNKAGDDALSAAGGVEDTPDATTSTGGGDSGGGADDGFSFSDEDFDLEPPGDTENDNAGGGDDNPAPNDEAEPSDADAAGTGDGGDNL